MARLMKLSTSLFFLLCVLGCSANQPVSKTTAGTLGGATAGAGLGAIIGSQTGKAGPGIAVGAAAGAIAGALLGNQLDQTDREMAAQREQIDRNQQIIEENRKLIEELRRRGADVTSTSRGVVINLPDILFGFDRADLTPEAGQTIAGISEVLRGVKDRNISVEGHTDSVGSFTYNKRLSVDRATNVARELERNGIPKNQLEVSGYGEGVPIATNSTAAGRTRNRRVEVIVQN